ncbi:hypothetical protein BIZ37_29480 [Photobacterium sp. BZF1]|uniref:hypothetical protein n=1 Tax=Photobacterium sp. BZF1 TaxID=1904457 RepID=UPI0016539BAA|nr:hypothetical protein [Photobacterium sp. BZF1]MBC7006687.1 hypothetical protein [Photobacterium sp. BZF1]
MSKVISEFDVVSVVSAIESKKERSNSTVPEKILTPSQSVLNDFIRHEKNILLEVKKIFSTSLEN